MGFDRARVRARKRKRKVSRRASNVKVYFDPARKVERRRFVTGVDIPRDEVPALSQWVELRPDNIHPWDWHALYPGADKSFWSEMIEEIQHAVETGEITEYKGVLRDNRTRSDAEASSEQPYDG